MIITHIQLYLIELQCDHIGAKNMLIYSDVQSKHVCSPGVYRANLNKSNCLSSHKMFSIAMCGSIQLKCPTKTSHLLSDKLSAANYIFQRHFSWDQMLASTGKYINTLQMTTDLDQTVVPGAGLSLAKLTSWFCPAGSSSHLYKCQEKINLQMGPILIKWQYILKFEWILRNINLYEIRYNTTHDLEVMYHKLTQISSKSVQIWTEQQQIQLLGLYFTGRDTEQYSDCVQ